jgi:hypothetical protein
VEVPPHGVGETHEAAVETRRAAVVGEDLGEGGDVLLDPAVGEEAKADRVEGILRETEEVRVDLTGPGNLDEVEMGFPIDRRLGRSPSETGRA